MERPPRVLLIGWRFEAVEALHCLGADVTCVLSIADDASRAGVLDDVHTVVVSDASNTEATLSGLERLHISVADFDVITSQFEFTLATAAVIGADRSPQSVRTVVAMRDKQVQKRLIKKAKIPTAESTQLVHSRELADAPFPRGVVKPLDRSGTRGVRSWRDEEQRRNLAAELANVPGPWIVEEWVDGAELHLDGVVRGGEVLFISVGRYVQNVLDIRQGGIVATVLQRPEESASVYDASYDIAQRSMSALGHEEGVFHLEVFEQPNGLVFGECGARIPGGSFDRMIHRQHNVDLNEEWARTVLGFESVAAPSVAETYFGDVFLTAPAGILQSSPDEHEVRAQDGVRYASLRVQAGDELTEASEASSAYAGTAVVEGQNPQQTRARIQHLAHWFSEKTVVSHH